MSKFQIILLGLFAFFAVGGLIFFSQYSRSNKDLPAVVIWGTIDSDKMNKYIVAVLQEQNLKTKISYVQKNPDSMYQQYVEALAINMGPDALLMSHDYLLNYSGKFLFIPYTSIPEQEFKQSFIEESELYLDTRGLRAVPFTVDPLVMYWNRDLFNNAAISTPPKYWQDFITQDLITKLTKRNAATTITQSAVGLGEYRNIAHSKEILTLLMMQAGNPVVAQTEQGMRSFLNQDISQSTSASLSSLLFYTQFANPLKETYSWNKSMQNSQIEFTSNRLAVYFGFASEYPRLKQINPNLNFDVATMPQLRSRVDANPVNMTFGKLYGFSVARSSLNAAHTLGVIQMLTSKTSMPLWLGFSDTPSVRRDALALDPSSALSFTFGQSALWSRGWLDPNNAQTNIIFGDLIENVTSNREEPDRALEDAHERLENLLKLQ